MLWFHVCPLMFRQQAVFDAIGHGRLAASRPGRGRSRNRAFKSVDARLLLNAQGTKAAILAETVEGARFTFDPHSPTPGKAVAAVNGLGWSCTISSSKGSPRAGPCRSGPSSRSTTPRRTSSSCW